METIKGLLLGVALSGPGAIAITVIVGMFVLFSLFLLIFLTIVFITTFLRSPRSEQE